MNNLDCLFLNVGIDKCLINFYDLIAGILIKKVEIM